MNEWIRVIERLPQEGTIVDVRFGGIERANVLFQEGRFWQVHTGLGTGIDLPAEEWRSVLKKGKVIDAHATDGIQLSEKA